MTHLYLTQAEKQLFDALPDSLKEGWETEAETTEAYERAEELDLRYRMAHLTDPVCRELLEKAKNIRSRSDFERIASAFDVSALTQEQLAEVFFILGSRLIGYMMHYLLVNVKTDEDIEGIGVLSLMRHYLFETNASLPSAS